MSGTPVRGRGRLIDSRAHQGMSKLDRETVVRDQSGRFGGVQVDQSYLTAGIRSRHLFDGAGL